MKETQAQTAWDTSVPEDWFNINAPEFNPFEDSDLDGISNGSERIIGTDPHQRDTDQDGIEDGDELLNNSHPLIKTKEDAQHQAFYLDPQYWDIPQTTEINEQYREKYRAIASEWLGSQQSWENLYIVFNGPKSTGEIAKRLDGIVLKEALESGVPLQEAVCCLAQSPYIQYQLHNHLCNKTDVQEYLQYRIREYDRCKERDEKLEAFIQGKTLEIPEFNHELT